MQLTHKVTGGQVKILDAAQGIVEAYVNTMGVVDYDGEIIAPGAFDRAIARSGKLPKVAWFHDQRIPVGRCIETTQVGSQQRVVAQFNLDTQRGREAFSDVQFGSVDEWSVGFYALEWDSQLADGEYRRVIKELDWVEFSPVMRGASPHTATVSAKAQEPAPAASSDAAGTEERAARQHARQGLAYRHLSLRTDLAR